jgi:hypothetical protein
VRPNQIETWAYRVLEAVQTTAFEDARVELKRSWPTDHRSTARRLAGHANAARGEPILWLIGVENDGSIRGAAPEKTSDWWAQVTAHFGETIHPSMQDVILREADAMVVALAFETDRAPYVVKVKEGASELEVPWREATRVRSAKRRELLLMLSEAIQLPQVEVRSADASAIVRQGATELVELEVKTVCYFDVVPDHAVVMPFHRCQVRASAEAEGWQDLAPGALFKAGEGSGAVHARSTPHDLTLTGPAMVDIYAWGQIAKPLGEPTSDLDGSVEMWPTRSDVPVRFTFSIPFVGEGAREGTIDRAWRWSTTPP